MVMVVAVVRMVMVVIVMLVMIAMFAMFVMLRMAVLCFLAIDVARLFVVFVRGYCYEEEEGHEYHKRGGSHDLRLRSQSK